MAIGIDVLTGVTPLTGVNGMAIQSGCRGMEQSDCVPDGFPDSGIL